MTSRNQWWPVALISEVQANTPIGVSVAGEEIVVFRDNTGTVRALENRCPHRRVPLSLGKVRPEGWLQCGYHGWSFDGATGQCKAIPNLRQSEQVPGAYGVYAYRAVEQNGLIYVSTDAEVLEVPAIRAGNGEVLASGRQMIGLGMEELLAALLDGPDLLAQSAGVRLSDILVADPERREGALVMERAAFWPSQMPFYGFVHQYRLLFRLAILPGDRECELSLVAEGGEVLATAHWAMAPSARGVTAIFWQLRLPGAGGMGRLWLQLCQRLGKAPLAPRSRVDFQALSTLLAGPSHYWTRQAESPSLYGDLLLTQRAKR
ncbi:MAG: Rieske (2Fe-2S) protein [Porticoccaceae bacterium]|nr:Rieske (2Fe-2S) protein [Porticoccaceae bacterium]